MTYVGPIETVEPSCELWVPNTLGSTMGAHIRDFGAYVDFLSTVLLCAPDRFPRRDWRTEDEQINLERAFQILNEKFALVSSAMTAEEKVEAMRLLGVSRDAYRSGDRANGASAIQQFRSFLTDKKP